MSDSTHIAAAIKELLEMSSDKDFSDEQCSDESLVENSCYDFRDTGLLTNDDGVLLKLEDGSEFQITVIQSKHAR